jgi:hypothetical protein
MDSDAGALGRLGYAQELLRRMGGFSSFAVSFSIISVLTGCITAYADAIGPGGPAALGLGWPLVSVGTMFVALAMAELASAFPTAGALYHWSALLGSAGWGWMTAAMNLVGQVAIVAAIDFGCASELAATLGLGGGAPFYLLTAILASHALFNAFSVRLVAWLNDFSAVVHILGVVILVGALLAFGRAQPVSFLAFTGFTTRSDGNLALGFANGLVLSMFTFTGYDASAHLAEETHDPARRTPWGILMSVVVSAVAGYLLLVAITLAIRDLPAVAVDRHAALTIMRVALGDGFGRVAMALALAAMWFCGLSSARHRALLRFALRRDGEDGDDEPLRELRTPDLPRRHRPTSWRVEEARSLPPRPLGRPRRVDRGRLERRRPRGVQPPPEPAPRQDARRRGGDPRAPLLHRRSKALRGPTSTTRGPRRRDCCLIQAIQRRGGWEKRGSAGNGLAESRRRVSPSGTNESPFSPKNARPMTPTLRALPVCAA